MSIQQSINQLLGSASVATAMYAHSPAGQRKFKLKDLEGQSTRAMERIIKPGETITDMSPEAFADLQERVGEFNKITEEYAKLTPDVDEALELDATRVAINEEINKKARERMEIEQKKQAAVQAALDEKQKSQQIRDMIELGAPQIYPKREVIKYGN